MRGLPTCVVIGVALALTSVSFAAQVPRTAAEDPGRAVWLDFDDDGLSDLYSVAAGREDVLLRNVGDGRFADATTESGLGGNTSQAVRPIDYDDDDRSDILLVGVDGALRLFRASGGAFQEVTAETGLSGAPAAVRAAWIDYDEDGWTDLWIENASGHPTFFHNQNGIAFERVDVGLAEPAASPVGASPVPTAKSAGPAAAADGRVVEEGGGSEVAPPHLPGTRRSIPRDVALVGLESDEPGEASPSPTPASILPLVTRLGCIGEINDSATGNCVKVSSEPALGTLYPLGPEFNIHPPSGGVFGPNLTGNVGIGTTVPRFDLHVIGDVKGEGDASGGTPTNGYLGARGMNDFDGIPTADFSTYEMGVVGIATDSGSSDNFGVIGHSNGVGVRGEYSGSRYTDFAELGKPGVGIEARGSVKAAEFHGDIQAFGDLDVVGDVDVFGKLYVTQDVEVLSPVALHSTLTNVLDVQLTGIGSLGRAANIQRTASASSANDILQIVAEQFSSPSAQLIEAERLGDVEFRVDVSGDTFCDGSFTGGGADFAEMVRVSTGVASVEPGDLLVIDPTNPRAVLRSGTARSTLVAGVYSTKPGFVGSEREWDAKPAPGSPLDLMGEAVPLTRSDMAVRYEEVPMAVLGIVPVKASAQGGPIRTGDLLVSSSLAGHVMRDSDPAPGTIVGKALEPLDSGSGRILVLVTLQ